MNIVIAIHSPGAMGSAIAARLEAWGTRLTSLESRGAATVERARTAGMEDVSPKTIATADLILSMTSWRGCRPGQGVSERPVKAATAGFSMKGPKSYLSGGRRDTRREDMHPSWAELGLDLRQIEGPIGAAAALKMSYSGISKGLTAIGAAMLLAASRSGSSRTLYQELSESLPQLLSRFETGIPDMYPKAYRWVAEMREIATFLGEDKAAAMIFEGAAQLYDQLSADIANEGQERDALDEFFRSK